MIGLAELLNLDTTPLDSDFESFELLIKDMESFIETHRDWIIRPADDPGFHHIPSRIPRKGWIAHHPDNEEDIRVWTIPLGKIAKSKIPIPEFLNPRPYKPDLAEQYLIATGTDKMWHKMMDQVMFDIACIADPEDMPEVKQLKDRLTWDCVKEPLGRAVTDIIPADILIQLVEFYNDTEPGQYLSEHFIEIFDKISGTMTEYVQNIISDIEAKKS